MNQGIIFPNTRPNMPPPPSISPPQGAVSPPPSLPNQNPPPPAKRSFSMKIIIAGVIGVVFLIMFFLLIMRHPAPPTNKPVTLTYWGLWEDNRVMQGILDDFHRANPRITVNYVKQDIKQYRDRLETRITNGDGPDIFRYHNTWLPMLSSLLLPMSTDVITPKDFQKSYYPVAQADLMRNGAIFGIPLEIDTLSLFTNDQIFQAAGVSIPATWIDFAKTAKALTVPDPITGNITTAGAALGSYDNITHASDVVSLLLLQNGTNLKDLPASSKYIIDALTFYTNFAKGQDSVWDPNRESSIQAFANGNLAMYFGYSWDIPAIKAMNRDLKFQVNPVPNLPKIRKMTIASYWVEGVSSKTKNPREAMEFMHYLTQKDVQQKLFTEEAKLRQVGEPYSRVDLANTLKDNPLVYPFVAQAGNAVSSYFASDTYDNGLNEQTNGYLGNTVRSLLGNTSMKSAVDVLSKGVAQILGRYGVQ